MNTDFRVATTLETNAKFLDLVRLVGGVDRAVALLFRLWSWTALHRPAGDLTGIPPELLRITRDEWAALLAARKPGGAWGFVEVHSTGAVQVHEWEQHNGWCSSAELRSASARKAGKASAAAKREAKARRRAGRQTGMIVAMDDGQRPLPTGAGAGVATPVETGVRNGTGNGGANSVSGSGSGSVSGTGPGESPNEGVSLWRATRSRRLAKAVSAASGIRHETAMQGATWALLEIQAIPESDPALDPGERWIPPAGLVAQALAGCHAFRRAGEQ